MLFVPTAFNLKGRVTTLIPGSAGTIITDNLSVWTNTSNAFDGITSQTENNSAAANGHSFAPVGTNFIGKNWGTGIKRKIVKIVLVGPTDNSLIRGGGNSVAWNFDGSNDGSSWTVLDSGTTDGTFSEVITRTSATINTLAGFQYHRISAPGNGVNGFAVTEWQLFEEV